jgi:hypothetical protein
VGNNVDFDQQIALLYQQHPSTLPFVPATRAVWSADNNWQFHQISSAEAFPYYPSSLLYPRFDQIDGTLFAGDAQGRSLLLGSPFNVAFEDHLQPEMVPGIPPMHIDYIKNTSNQGPLVINFTVFPSTASNNVNATAFNTQYAFTSEGATKHEDSNTTDVSDSTGVENKGEITFGAGDSSRTSGRPSTLTKTERRDS